MRPVVRVIGKILRLVGISSPEDSLRRPMTASDLPSWRTPKPPSAKPEESADSVPRNDAIVGAILATRQATWMVGFESGNET
jgi:hypothetical protein